MVRRTASGRVGNTTYDQMNRVVHVAAPGHHVVTTTYDRLFRRTVTDATGQVYRDSVNALGWTVARTDPTGAVTTYRYNRDGLLTSTTNWRQRVVQDVNGNVIGLFTGSSTISERETYAPWGTLETGALTALADTNRLRWKGLVWEGDSTQLYYVRARWYDPVNRRFVSEDPLGIEGGTIRMPMAEVIPSPVATPAACWWTMVCVTSGGRRALPWTATHSWGMAATELIKPGNATSRHWARKHASIKPKTIL